MVKLVKIVFVGGTGAERGERLFIDPENRWRLVWSPYNMVAAVLLYLYNMNIRKEYGDTTLLSTLLSMRSTRKLTACRSP